MDQIDVPTKLSTRQYARIVDGWVRTIGLDPAAYGTHTMRRTKPSLIYRRTKNPACGPAAAGSHEDGEHSQILGHRGR